MFYVCLTNTFFVTRSYNFNTQNFLIFTKNILIIFSRLTSRKINFNVITLNYIKSVHKLNFLTTVLAWLRWTIFKYATLFSDCRNKNALFTFGLSQSCKQISISCLQKIEDIIQGNGIPEQDYVALPMKLPTKCIFDPVCTFKEEVEFFNTVGVTQSELISPIIPEIFYEDEFFYSPVEEVYVQELPPFLLPEPVSPFFGYENPYTPRPFYARPPVYRYPGFYR